MQSILVALDGTDLASVVLDAAVDMARREGARLRLLHVIPVPPSLPPGLLSAGPASVTEYFEEEGRKLLEERAKLVPADLLAGMQVRMGAAWREICASAKKEDVDVIVIGAHQHGAIGRMLGTTAANVVNNADRSVFVVRTKPGR